MNGQLDNCTDFPTDGVSITLNLAKSTSIDVSLGVPESQTYSVKTIPSTGNDAITDDGGSISLNSSTQDVNFLHAGISRLCCTSF